MKLLKAIRLYTKFIYLFLLGKVIRKNEYKEEYDKVSRTYSRWIERMKKHTDEILRIDLLEKETNTDILDFACGTGYISNSLLGSIGNPHLSVTAVDISEKMLEIAQLEIDDPRCTFVLQDGMSFLEMEESEKYNAIYFGFGIPYFNRRKVVKQFNRILKENGTVHLISNCRGTLEGISEIYLDLMKDDPSMINRIMEIGFNLPKSEKSLKTWFSRYSFDTISLKTVNELMIFKTPIELYDWLKQTGAIAGTGKIFTESKVVDNKIIEKIKDTLAYKNQYRINHKFILAIFQKSSQR
ncbi:MAG: methyltransferase domain-containing protein [Asgard group archaeon]|nr:methyltransferase domain-containing protein [Asgard group archaeon]